MNFFKLYILIVLSLMIYSSCSDDAICSDPGCNYGVFNSSNCNCFCDSLVLGPQCDRFDSTKVQTLLDNGFDPMELLKTNIILDSLYGKTFKGGLIFYVDTLKGTGLIASPDNLPGPVFWGCFTKDIPDIPNVSSIDPNIQQNGAKIGDGFSNTEALLLACNESGIAARLCRNLGSDWYLPSISELIEMRANLKQKGHGFFFNSLYWSSTEKDLNQAWLIHFSHLDITSAVKNSYNSVRAVKNF